MPGTTVTDFTAESPPPPTKCSLCLKVIRKLLSFLLSHIGLLSLVVGYCIMGAFIFEELERHNEIEVKRNMTKNRLLVTDDLWEITKSMEVLKEEQWQEEVTSKLRLFEKSLIIALKEKGWDGKESEETVTWTFAGGLFYSITVITTIGYGHIAPKTAIAKIVTIFYAILGIPLTVLCWSNIGDAMANAFRFCYWRICCYVCTKKPKKKKKRLNSRGRATSVRNPVGRTRSMRRSIKTHRSADTYSDSLVSYSISDQERFYCDEGGSGAAVPPPQEGFQRNRPSKRSLPRSLQIPPSSHQAESVSMFHADHSICPETSITVPSTGGNLAVPKETTGGASSTIQEKVEKKPSTAARVARGLGLKRSEKDTQTNKQTNKDTPKVSTSNATTTPSTLMPTSPTMSSLNGSNNSGIMQQQNPIQISGAPTSVPTTSPAAQSSVLPISSAVSTKSTAPVTVPATPTTTLTPTIQAPGYNASGTAPTPYQVPTYRLDRVPEDEWTIIDDYYDDYVSEEEMEDFSTKPVPIWLSIFLVIGYIVGGAFLFREWEGWSLLDSSYFCFVTLTTIGFGDLVPDQKNTDGEIRIALCSLYLLFGIAMICMSFNLVQEEVIKNVKGFAMQLGIIKDEDEEDE